MYGKVNNEYFIKIKGYNYMHKNDLKKLFLYFSKIIQNALENNVYILYFWLLFLDHLVFILQKLGLLATLILNLNGSSSIIEYM